MTKYNSSLMSATFSQWDFVLKYVPNPQLPKIDYSCSYLALCCLTITGEVEVIIVKEKCLMTGISTGRTGVGRSHAIFCAASHSWTARRVGER